MKGFGVVAEGATEEITIHGKTTHLQKGENFIALASGAYEVTHRRASGVSTFNIDVGRPRGQNRQIQINDSNPQVWKGANKEKRSQNLFLIVILSGLLLLAFVSVLSNSKRENPSVSPVGSGCLRS